MNIICLDIEATNKGEILELSIIRFKDNVEIYHSYFKPIHSENWPTNVHHITPDMVNQSPKFSSERNKIQVIINDADAILGFALHNDIKYLTSHKIIIPKDIYLLEAQNWFWYFKGKEMGIEFNAVPKLSKCAEILGYTFSEENDAHSATNDTLITIMVFKNLLSQSSIEKISVDIIQDLNKKFEIERKLYAKKIAKGIISLVSCSGGYCIKNNAFGVVERNDFSITVASRYIAEHELREKFRKKETALNSGIYRLNQRDIDYFLHYSNEYNFLREESLRRIYSTQKSHRKNLSFNII